MAVPAFGLVGNRVSERWGAPGDGVLIDVGLNSHTCRILQRCGGGEVREPWGQIQAGAITSREEQPCHFSNDRFLELRSFARGLDQRHFP